jgi:hypothetical protein
MGFKILREMRGSALWDARKWGVSKKVAVADACCLRIVGRDQVVSALTPTQYFGCKTSVPKSGGAARKNAHHLDTGPAGATATRHGSCKRNAKSQTSSLREFSTKRSA